MDRRSVLIGSGTAFTIAMAGCMGGDDDDDGEPTEQTGSGGGGGDDDGDDDGDGRDGDLPGIDEDKLKEYLQEYSDRIRVRKIERDGGTLHVELELIDGKKDKVMNDFGDGMKKAVTDVDHLKRKIDWLEVVLFHDGERVASLKVNVDWLVKLVKEEIDPKKLADMLDDHDG